MWEVSRVRLTWSWVIGSLLVSGWSCGGTGASSSATGGTGGTGATGGRAPEALCIPFAQVACACTDGQVGAQNCKDDGSGFNACVCTTPAAGGASGAGAGGRGSVAGGPDDDQPGQAGTGEAGDSGMNPIADDFPDQPIVEDGVPANAPDLFAAATDTATSPLCVLEPQLSSGDLPGAMFPKNWLRPRFRVAASDFDLFQIRLHSPAESNDLVVYTTGKTWYLPKQIWSGQGANPGLGAAAAGGAVTVTIRALDSKAPQSAARVSGSFNVAAASASGSVLFPTLTSWSLTPNSYRVLGFSVGEEGVQSVLGLTQIAWDNQLGEDGAVLNGYYAASKPAGFLDGQVRRISHPTLTPDAESLVFMDDYPYPSAVASLTASSVGSVPSYIGHGAAGMLRMPWLGTPSLSAAHWASSDRVLVSSYGTTFMSGTLRTKAWNALPTYTGVDGATEDDEIKWHQLAWFDLEASFDIDFDAATLGYGAPQDAMNAAVAKAKGKSWGLIATGDTGLSDVSPSFNAAGDTIAYVATDSSPFSEPDTLSKTADVRTVPYNQRAGGTSQPLLGASDSNYWEYEPTFSPDGKFVAFTRAPLTGPDGPFRNRLGEITLVPAKGGTPTPLAANEPNACAGDALPLALLNGSPAWAPDVVHSHGRTYYFLVFTSARNYGDEFSTPFQIGGTDYSGALESSTQLYLATIVVDDQSGAVETFPAVYLWNQNRVADTDGSGVGTSHANLTPVWGSTALAPLQIEPAK